MYATSYVYTWLILAASSMASSHTITEWLAPDAVMEFESKRVPHTGLLNRLNWVEKNERSTSRNYTLWDEADVYILEWPGNVTIFDPEKPLVKWGKQRAKYIEDSCGLEYTGIEMRAYAYNYVYLTWGENRLTRTFTSPLTVPRSILKGTSLAKLSKDYTYNENALNTVEVSDIAFTFDTLLLAYYDGIIRVFGLEMAYAEVSKTPKRKLRYSLSRGIKGPVDKIIVQDCCVKTDFCSFGSMVVAYKEQSLPHVIYSSSNGGESFYRIKPRPSQIGVLKLVLSYPEYSRLLVFHGSDKIITMSQIDLYGVGYAEWNESTSLTFPIKGTLQGNRLGMESSFVVWDNCSVWYSPDTGFSITRSLLYIHDKITSKTGKGLNVITSEHCRFGEHSVLAHGPSGKFGLLDGGNTLFFGVDVKNNLSQLVALKMDMSLLIRGKELSVAPFFESTSDQPKLMYPPRYLELPESIKLGRTYERRLGMRILPKNVYPSDYILSFYDENIKSQKINSNLRLQPCQTSSLQVNNSITQKRKLYYLSPSTQLNFTVRFTSRSRKLRQLNVEPKRVLKFLSARLIPESIDIVGNEENPRYSIKHRVLIKSNPHFNTDELFRLNFYTKQDLRCNVQPSVTVYIKLKSTLANVNPRHLSDEDMAQSVFLKSVTAGETTYLQKGKGLNLGETFKVETCPFKK